MYFSIRVNSVQGVMDAVKKRLLKFINSTILCSYSVLGCGL